MKLVVTYVLLALVSTAVNIGSQDIVARLYTGPYAIVPAMVTGTAAGLLAK